MNVIVGFFFHMRSILLYFSWNSFFNFTAEFQLNYFIYFLIIGFEIGFLG